MLKKLLCICLAALMLVGVLASCNPSEEPGDTTVKGQTTTGGTNDHREPLGVPNTRYDGQELCFLTRDEKEWSTVEIFAGELSSQSDNISTAVYERNDRIFQDYGVTVKEYKMEITSHIEKVTKENAAPTGDFQAIISNTDVSATLASQGALWDLYSDDIEYLDVTKSWWDTNMAKGMSINDHLYFATGDLLTADNDATFVILFNKEIVADVNIPDLYTLVEKNQWTMDKFYEFEQLAIQDKGGDGLDFDTDVCGFAYTQDASKCFVVAGGVTMCTKDEDDAPVYSLNIKRASDLSDKTKLLFSKDYTVDMTAATSSGNDIVTVGQITFGGGHALFMGEVLQAVTRLRQYDVDFGILPFPMYDVAQGKYYSMMHNTASMVSIPKSVGEDDVVMVSSMIEAMAYHSADTLTEQYYEINLKTKGAKDEKSGPMIDKILENRACDLAYYYKWGSGAFDQLASTMLPSSSLSVSSVDSRVKSRIKREIQNLLDDMDDFK